MLRNTEVDYYHEHGYVVPAFCLSPERLQRLRLALDRVIAANPGKRPEQLVSVHVAGKN